MDREIVVKKLEELLSAYSATSLMQNGSDIMSAPLLLSEREAASFFLDVEKEFKVDLNELIPDLFVYSIDAVANKLLELCGENSVCYV
jgi:hypothetical protein